MNRLEKVIAVALQAAAGVLLFSAGNLISVDDVYILTLGLPGVAAGLGGMLLWGKASKQVATGPEKPVLPTSSVDVNQELLAALQEELGRMKEEREFLQQLYVEPHGSSVPAPSPKASRTT